MSADRINVMHIIQNSNRGGVQLQLLNLVRNYDKNLIRPTVCCLGHTGEVGRLMQEQSVDFAALNVKRHYRFSPRLIIALYRLMKSRHIHVVRAHKYSSSLYGRIAAFLAGIPVVITSVHGNYHKDKRLERSILNRILAWVTTRIVAMSESIAADIRHYDRIDPAKILIVRNGVDTSLFSPEIPFRSIRPAFSIVDSDILIGVVGRLVPAKGLEHLIDALADLRQACPAARLLIVGHGQLLEALRERAGQKGVKDYVIFAGERGDIADILASLDIFVMPSIAEGLPNALLEAMSMGKPVIVTAAGGMPEIIQHGVNGLVVPVGDPAALSQALQQLISDRKAASVMGRAARDVIQEGFSIQATARNWEALYQALLREKGLPVPVGYK